MRPEARAEVLDKAAAMLPALDGAEPVASYAGLRPAGADGVNYVIGPSPRVPAAHQRRRDPLDRAVGLAGDRRARGGARRAGTASRSAPTGRCRPATSPAPEVPWWRRRAWLALILGVDEGTTGVKAALFDERLRPGARGAAATRSNRHPQPGWVEQDGEEVLRRGRRGDRRAARGRARRGRRLRPGPPGRVGAGLGRGDRRAAVARSSSGRTSARRRCSTACADDEEEIQAPQRPALRPLLLGRQARLAARARRGGAGGPRRRARCAWERSTRSCATASAPASPPTPPPPRARSCTRWGRPASTRGCASASACRSTCCPRCATPSATSACCATTRGRSSCRCARRPSTSRPRWPARAASCPGRVKATYGTGVFVLAHVGDEVPEPAGGPAADRRLEHRRPASSTRIDGGVFTAGAMLEWLCRELGAGAPTRRRWARWHARPRTAAGARVLPALAGIGAPWWRPEARAVLAGLHGGTTRATSPARRSRASPGAWPTWSRRCASSVDVDALRVDGGLTNEPLMLAAAGRRDRRAGRGAAAPTPPSPARRRWPPSARACSARCAEAAELLPVDRRVEPHARRRSGATPSTSAGAAFVAAAAELR